MNKVKIILSYILGFILSLCILLLVVIYISKRTVLDKNFILRMFDENNYYENVYTSISEDVNDYMTSSGLESEVLDNVLLKENVKSDIDNYLNGLYSGTLYNVDTSYVEDTLKTNINNYLKGLNLGVDNTNELDLFTSDIGNIYKKQVSFYNTIDFVSSKIVKINNLINKYTKVLCVISVILLVTIILLGYVNIGSSFLGSGIMLFLIKLFIYERLDTDNILLVSDNFSSIIRSSFKYIGSFILNTSIILMVFGFILCLFKNRKNNLEKRNTN